jgi:hypothetical protein
MTYGTNEMRRLLLLTLLVFFAHAAFCEASFESLGAPCYSRQVLAGRAVLDRQTGRELFVLTNMNEISRMELIFIDPQVNTARVFKAPVGDGSWALNEVPGDRLIVGTYYDGTFMVFDLKSMQFVKTAKFEGEDYLWNFAMGGDGRLYTGTYAHAKLGALDLNTYAVEDCGGPAAPNQYLRMVSEMPDGRILCSFGMEKPTVKIYDPASKAWSDPPESIKGITVGCVWDGVFLAGALAFDKALAPVSLPCPVPDALKGALAVDAYCTLQNGPLVLGGGSGTYIYNKGDRELTKVYDFALRGGRILAATKSGSIFGVRGQDYFVIKPGDTELKLKLIPGEVQPRKPHFLKCDPDGRVWGGPTFGQTLFSLDPATKKAENTGQICDGGGEVYDATFWKEKVYAAAYSGGDIVEYDPGQPWDQLGSKNPRPVTSVYKEGFIRPTGGILTLADGTLVSGWMAAYGTYGGLVALTNPESGQSEYLKNTLAEQAVSSVATDGKKLFVTTTLSANGLPIKTGEKPHFGVIDIATKKVEFNQEFESNSCDRVYYDAMTGYAIFTTGPTRVFDTKKAQIVEPWPTAPPSPSTGKYVGNGDGRVYYGSKDKLIRLDIATGATEEVATAPGNIEAIALHPSGDVIVSVGPEVYRVRVA